MKLIPKVSIGKEIPKSYFGMHVNNALPQNKHPYNSKECPLFTDLGYGTIRFWDAYVVHRLVNTAQGVHDWVALDYRVNAAKAAGLKIIYTFGAPPDWATVTPGPYPNYNPNPVTQLSYLTNFATALATRYKGRIDYYEIYNEVDSSGSWVGSISEMITIGQALYIAVKTADPACLVMSPNTISWGALNGVAGLGYLDQYLKGAADYCDLISMHCYTDPTQPESYYELARAYITLSSRYGGKPVVCSETGVLSYYDNTGVIVKPLNHPLIERDNYIMSQDQGASWVARMLLMGWLGGLDMLCYYLLDNTNGTMAIAMINYLPGSGAPVASIKYKPAQAYEYIAKLLVGGHLYGYQQLGYRHQAQFILSNGVEGVVTWCSDYKTVSIDLSGYSSAKNCLGLSVSITNNYTLDNLPIFIFK